MKILHIINDLSSGGAESLLNTITPIQNKYNEVSILTLSNKKNVFENSLKEKGIKVYNTKISNNVYNPLQILDIRKYIKKYDIIHVHLFPSFYWVAIANKSLRLSKRIILTEHSTSNNRRDKKIFKYIDKYIYSLYEKSICISDDTKNELEKWIGRVKNKDEYFRVINNGIDTRKFIQAESYDKKLIFPKYKKNDVLLLMIARFNKQKDHITVIKAMKKLPEEYKLILVGEGDTLHSIKSIIKELNLEDRVEILGFREDIPNIIKTCDIGILSSNYEGFGLAAIEYMAGGLPTIVSDVDGVKNIVGDGGIIFEKGNEIDLANKVTNIIEDKELYNYKVEKGIARSLDFDIITMVEKLNSVYENLMVRENSE